MFGSEADPEAKAGIEDVDLSGRTALVTGSTSGLGREAALALGRLGADVVVHGRDEAAGERVVEDGAATIVYLAASPEVGGVTGTYFPQCRERRPAPDATDAEAQRTLRRRSAELLDIEELLADAVED